MCSDYILLSKKIMAVQFAKITYGQAGVQAGVVQ
jgi:hypothetical protein